MARPIRVIRCSIGRKDALFYGQHGRWTYSWLVGPFEFQHPLTRNVYAVVLKKGDANPVEPQSDEEKVGKEEKGKEGDKDKEEDKDKDKGKDSGKDSEKEKGKEGEKKEKVPRGHH